MTNRLKAALVHLLYNRVILSHKVTEKLGDKFDDHAMGTGPYKFVSWERGSHLTMQENDKYWCREGNVKEIIGQPIKRDGAWITALEAGRVNPINIIPPHEVERLQRYLILCVELLEQLGRFRREDCSTVPTYNAADAYGVRRDLVSTARSDEKIQLVEAMFL